MRSALRPLAASRFRMLFFGRPVSFLGNAMAPVAPAFAVLDLTGSAEAIGLSAAVILAATLAVLAVPDVRRLPRHVPA